MTGKRFTILFSGFWGLIVPSELPSDPGVYAVQACEGASLDKTQPAIARRLLLIGKTANLRGEVESGARLVEWSKLLQENESLLLSFAEVFDEDYRQRVWAALSFVHKPEHNKEGKYVFPHDFTIVESQARNDHFSERGLIIDLVEARRTTTDGPRSKGRQRPPHPRDRPLRRRKRSRDPNR